MIAHQSQCVRANLSRAFMGAAAAVVLWTSQAFALTQEEIANYSGADRQKVLEQGARQEGRVAIYSGMIVDQALRPMAEAFEKKYPFLKVDYWRGASPQIIQKALAEARAGKVQVDVLESTSLAPALVRAQVVQKFHSPESDNYPKHLVAENGLWASTRLSYFGAAINTNLVKRDEAPKTWDDLLNPKWKGKIAWRVGGGDSGAELFVTNLRLLWGDQKAEDYIKKLAKQDVVGYTSSARQLVNQVMAGEYAIALNIFLHHPLISAEKGAPVAPNPMEPIPSLNGTILMAKNAPHPYAAMLLIDFMMSKDGQETFLAGDYFPANPAISPSEDLRAIVPSVIGMKEQFITPDAVNDMNKKSSEWIKKYFR
ncbi:MAG: ABC transporter substrate-binding protein [Gemmatimonas sp.]